jgi:hypothetical protein
MSISGVSASAHKALRVQLLDWAATVLSAGCIAVTAAPFSVTVEVTDVTYSSVARMKALEG